VGGRARTRTSDWLDEVLTGAILQPERRRRRAQTERARGEEKVLHAGPHRAAGARRAGGVADEPPRTFGECKDRGGLGARLR